MPDASKNPLLAPLAVLYIAMAQSDDAELSSAELDAVIDTLHSRHFNLDRTQVQTAILETLNTYLEPTALDAAALRAVSLLSDQLSARQKAAVVDDLVQIAQSDGVVLDGERGLFTTLASVWNVAVPRTNKSPKDAPWTALHDLGYIYLVLAHSTDSEFSDDERQVLLRKLHAWKPDSSDCDINDVLAQVLDRYAQGANTEQFRAATASVKQAFPVDQRRVALDDLVQIANADGVFLDSEEDLINELMTAWDVTL